jgi:Protein of unknown function (DUF2846)
LSRRGGCRFTFGIGLNQTLFDNKSPSRGLQARHFAASSRPAASNASRNALAAGSGRIKQIAGDKQIAGEWTLAPGNLPCIFVQTENAADRFPESDAASGVARVYVLRDKAFAAIVDTGFQAYLDEAPMGDLKTGTFVYRDVPAGPHKLYFSRPMEMYRGSHQEFSAAAGRTYYFRHEYNDKGKWITASTIVAGAAGALVSSAVSAAADDRGLFDLTPLDETAARAAMAELRLAE